MLIAQKPANAGDLHEGAQNQEIITYLELSSLVDSHKGIFNSIKPVLGDIDNQSVFQKKARVVFYIHQTNLNDVYKTENKRYKLGKKKSFPPNLGEIQKRPSQCNVFL